MNIKPTRPSRPSRVRDLVTAGLLALATPGCDNARGSLDPVPGIEPLDAIHACDAALIALFEREPGRSFVVVGRVRASADARFEGMIDGARDAAGRVLKAQAARLGADAVVVDEAVVVAMEGGAIEQDLLGDFRSGTSRQRPAGPAYATRPVHRVVLVGRAIRWVDDPSSEIPATP
jgi:hypothetical protein